MNYNSYSEIKEKLLNEIFQALGIIAIPALFFSLLRFFDIGWQPVFITHIISAAIVILFSIYRKAIPYHIKTSCLIAVFISLAIHGVINIGQNFILVSYFTLSFYIGLVFWGRKAALLIYFGACAAIIIIGVLFINGTLSQSIDIVAYAKSFASWRMVFFDFSLITALVVIVAGNISHLLSKKVSELTMEITERKQAEDALQANKEDLKKANSCLIERAKELNCLYGLSQLVEQHNMTLENIFQELTELIPPGWQYPEITVAKVTFEDFQFKTSNFQKTAWIQSADIKANGQKVGTIEVCYLKEMPVMNEGPFLKEERSLLNALAERIGGIIERKQAEQKLQRQQYYLEKAQKLGHIGVWGLDIRRDRLYWTDENYRIFGVPAGSVPNYNAFMTKIHPDDREYVDRKWNAAIRGELYDIEHRLLVDGVTKWVREKAEIEYDKDGTAISAIGFTQDITNLKHAKDALQRANNELEQRVTERTRELAQANEQLRFALQKWQEIFQAIGQPTLILNPQYRITAANRAAVTAAGKSEKELIGKNCYEFFHGTDQHPQDCPMAKMLISGSLETVEMEMDAFGGLVLVSCTPIFDDAGNLVRIIHIATDITGRKQAEKKLLEYQGQLRRLSADLTLAEERERRQIATLLHDNITQTLVLFKIKLGLFRENELRKEVSVPFIEIYELLDDIIQDTRTLTFDLGCPILYEIGLEAAIRDLLETEISQEHKITTEFQTDGQHIYLEDDLRVVLYRAVKELFLNVVKHAGAGSIKFSMWKDKDKLWLRVEDDGVGLKKEPDDIKYSRAGGFGLFNIYERLEQLGGYVEIESEQGRGTQVTLAVPV